MKEQRIFLIMLIGALVFSAGCAPKVDKTDVSRRIEAIWNKGDLSLVDGLYAPEFVRHVTGEKDIQGPENYKQYIREARAVFPDFQIKIDDVVFEGDKGAGRFTWSGTNKGPLSFPDGKKIPATGKKATVTGISFFRMKDGKFVEEFVAEDGLGLMKQLGLVTGP